jgi:hypothetical protein
VVLRKVLGDPPANVRYHCWEWDEEEQQMMLAVYGASSDEKQLVQLDDERPEVASLEIEEDVKLIDSV